MPFYVVAQGRVPGVYDTWAAVLAETNHYSGAVYRKFETFAEAKAAYVQFTAARFREPDATYHVDGSCTPDYQFVSWAFVCDDLTEAYGLVQNGEAKALGNIAGELASAMRAVSHAEQMGYKKVTIVHDYLGISCWVVGLWTPKHPAVEAYIAYMKGAEARGVKIQFRFVKGHTGDKGNERADKLATYAIDEAKRQNHVVV